MATEKYRILYHRIDRGDGGGFAREEETTCEAPSPEAALAWLLATISPGATGLIDGGRVVLHNAGRGDIQYAGVQISRG